MSKSYFKNLRLLYITYTDTYYELFQYNLLDLRETSYRGQEVNVSRGLFAFFACNDKASLATFISVIHPTV